MQTTVESTDYVTRFPLVLHLQERVKIPVPYCGCAVFSIWYIFVSILQYSYDQTGTASLPY